MSCYLPLPYVQCAPLHLTEMESYIGYENIDENDLASLKYQRKVWMDVHLWKQISKTSFCFHSTAPQTIFPVPFNFDEMDSLEVDFSPAESPVHESQTVHRKLKVKCWTSTMKKLSRFYIFSLVSFRRTSEWNDQKSDNFMICSNSNEEIYTLSF